MGPKPTHWQTSGRGLMIRPMSCRHRHGEDCVREPAERECLRCTEGTMDLHKAASWCLVLDQAAGLLTGLPPQTNSTSSATSSASAPPVAALRTTFTPLTWGARVPSANLSKVSLNLLHLMADQCSASALPVAVLLTAPLCSPGAPACPGETCPASPQAIARNMCWQLLDCPFWQTETPQCLQPALCLVFSVQSIF